MAKKKPENPLRQKPLPTMEPIYHDEIDGPAEEYHETVTERMAMQGREEEMKEGLATLLHKAGLKTYETPGGIIVSLSNEEKIKVKKKKAPKEAEE